MADFATLRRNMVDSQLRTNKVTNNHVLQSMGEIPREKFLPGDHSDFAYIDEHLTINSSRTLVQPMSLGRMIQAAGISADAVVLDIGCATGYSSAVLGNIARAVVALESNVKLAELASSNMTALGLDNVVVEKGPVQAGWPDQAPYDVIMVNGACEQVPVKVFDQLLDGGCLCAVIRSGKGNGVARLWNKYGEVISGRDLFDANVPILPEFERKQGFNFA